MPGSCWTVIPSTPGAPLLRTTARNAVSMLSESQIASMRCSVGAGLSGSAVAVTASTSCQSRRGASPRPGIGKSSSSWYGGRVVVMRRPIYLPFPSTPPRGPFGPSASAPAYYALCLLLHRGQGVLRRPQSRRTRCRSLGVSPTAFIAHPPDLQFWPLMDMDFATSCPLVRPALPHIRFLFVGSRLCSTLPSDGPSRLRLCSLLVLRLCPV